MSNFIENHEMLHAEVFVTAKQIAAMSVFLYKMVETIYVAHLVQ